MRLLLILLALAALAALAGCSDDASSAVVDPSESARRGLADIAALGSPDAGGIAACCGDFQSINPMFPTAVGPWASGAQFSFCQLGQSCSDPSRSTIAVDFIEALPDVCPKRFSECFIFTQMQCCSWGCQEDSLCFSGSPPSCCSGSCAEVDNQESALCAMSSTEYDGGNGFMVTYVPACCSDATIIVPNGAPTFEDMPKKSTEWIVEWGGT